MVCKRISDTMALMIGIMGTVTPSGTVKPLQYSTITSSTGVVVPAPKSLITATACVVEIVHRLPPSHERNKLFAYWVSSSDRSHLVANTEFLHDQDPLPHTNVNEEGLSSVVSSTSNTPPKLITPSNLENICMVSC